MDAPRQSHPTRQLLNAGWSVRASPPADDYTREPIGSSGWLRIAELAPAASALRLLGQWSLDAPERKFDAEDWWYRLTFDAPRVNNTERSVLGFDGLATVAQVWLNGEELLRSTNMFVSHEHDVTTRLRDSGNNLLMRFSALDRQLEQRRKRPRWRAPMVAHQQLRWFRTTLLGRTPGWSPPAAVVGPWKAIWLERRGGAMVDDVRLEARVEGARGTVNCILSLDGDGHLPETVSLRLERNGRIWLQPLQRAGSSRSFTGHLDIDEVDLWWPHTHGDPALYDARVHFTLPDAANDTWVAAGRVGFRTVHVDTSGGDFSVSVNGVPVFCRGACWTPLDAVSLRSNADGCQTAVAQVRAAGMNMLRVPGTTVYEEDHFYDACDANGIMVWQDFMFANMDYPGEDQEFAESVELEVTQQLKRLRNHPCLAVLCGNSEVEQQAAMWGAARELWSPALFHETLPRLCHELAPSIFYWPSSAHGGAFPHQANTGTTSYYGVGAYLGPLEDARRADLKFATECLAFANVPAASTLSRVPGGHATKSHHAVWKQRSPRDLGAGWDFDDVRDHYVAALFDVEPQRLRAVDHERYLALSRATTGEVMRASFAEWRRPGSRCRGALVLMLRDLWAGAGWGLSDEVGVPKACWHYLKRALQPVAIQLSDEGVSGLFAHLINEGSGTLHAALEVTAWRDGAVKVADAGRHVVVPARGSLSVPCVELLDHFMDINHAYKFGPPACDAVAATLRDAGGHLLGRTFFFNQGSLGAQQPDVGLQARAVMLDAHTAQVTVRTARLAYSVYFEADGFEPDDDYFHLPPDSETNVVLRAACARPLSGFVHALNSTRSAPLQCAVPEAETRSSSS